MSPVDAVLILLAGVGAGVMNAVVGAGTLITFPTLLLLGYPPLLANMSNAVGLIPGSIAGAYGYRATLVGRGRIVRRLMLATASGGLLGALLLVFLPAGTFEAIVPALLIASAVLAAFQPRIADLVAVRRARRSGGESGLATMTVDTPAASGASSAPIAERLTPAIVFAVFGTGIYGGYFGAAQGVILLVVLGVALGGAMNSLNGIKNVLSGVANFISATLFVFIGEIDWAVAGLVAVGATIGGGLGGRYGRRLPANALRGLVVLVAVIAAVSRLIT